MISQVQQLRTEQPVQSCFIIETDCSYRVRFLYYRLALITCYLLDIDLALYSLLLLWNVKFNDSGNTFLQQKLSFMYMISYTLLLLLNENNIKSWICSNLMEIGFYSNKKKGKKNKLSWYDSNLAPDGCEHGALVSMAIGNLQIR